MKNFKRAGLILALLTVVIVAFQNTESVETKILFTTVSMPRAFLLSGCLGLGFLAGYLAKSLRARLRSME